MNRFLPLCVLIFILTGCSIFEEKTDEELVSEIIKEIREKPSATGPRLGRQISEEQRSRAENLTLLLNNIVYANKGSAQIEPTDQLYSILEERRQLILEIIKKQPSIAMKLALPNHLRSALSDNFVQKLLEQPTEVEGELEITFTEYDDKSKNGLQYLLKNRDGNISLHFETPPAGLISGKQVNAKGLMVADGDDNDFAMAIEGDNNILILALAEEENNFSSNGSPALTNTTGIQQTLVMLVNFQDRPDYYPWTLNYAQDLVFGTVNDYLYETSYQQTSLTGNVAGWYTLPIDPTCTGSTIAQYANAAANNAGVDLSTYDRFIYVFPRVTACGWSGKATVGGIPSQSWINGRFSLDIVAHEFGHNLGLYHSHLLECDLDIIGNNCSSIEYGDTFDMMGNVTTGHFNAFQKDKLGWLNVNATPIVNIVNSDETVTLAPYELVNSDLKVLMVPKSTDSVTGETTWYYLENRQAIGFDDSLLNNENMTNGVSIHQGNLSNGNSSYLLDMTPSSSSLGDAYDPALIVGESFIDPDAGVSITTDWSDNNGATVGISFDSQGCSYNNPSVTMSPSESQWVTAGTAVTYLVTVTNHDGSTCIASDFNISAIVPNGWSTNITNPIVSLAPGANTTTDLMVISPSTTADGFHDITAIADSSLNSNYSASATSTYVVSNNTTNSLPVVKDDSAETPENTAVIIDVLANDFDPDGDILTVIKASNPRKGTVSINTDNTLTFVPGQRAKGVYDFVYTVSDDTNNSSGTVSVSIISNKTTGGGGGGKGKKN